jgi:hypothetical protein
VIVEDLFQSGLLYHTIRNPLPFNFQHYVLSDDTLCNLPLPYRPCTDKERQDISDWLGELQGLPVPTQERSSPQEDYWNSPQTLLYFLNEGKAWDMANREVDLC